MVQGYNRWREWYGEMMEQKAKLAQALGRMVNRALANAFNSWKAWYEDMMDQKAKLAQAFGRMMSRAVVQAWNRWVEFVEELETQRQIATKAIARWQKQAISRAFVHWRDLAEAGLLGDAKPAEQSERAVVVEQRMAPREELGEEIDLSKLKRYHDFPVGAVNDYEPRKVMHERSYVARQRTFQVLAEAKEYTGIAHSRKYITSQNQMEDPKGSIPRGNADGLYRAQHQTEMPWTALHTSDRMRCTAKPARDVLSEFMLASAAADSANIKQMQERSERSHRDNKKKFFGKWVHDDFESFDNWLRVGGDSVQDT